MLAGSASIVLPVFLIRTLVPNGKSSRICWYEASFRLLSAS